VLCAISIALLFDLVEYEANISTTIGNKILRILKSNGTAPIV
jgi:hypothetical protein